MTRDIEDAEDPDVESDSDLESEDRTPRLRQRVPAGTG